MICYLTLVKKSYIQAKSILKKIIINQIFEKGKKNIFNRELDWKYIYSKIKGDLLATGKSSDGFTYQDYINNR